MQEKDFEDFFRSMRPKLLAFAARQVDPEAANDIAIQALTVIWNKDLPAPSTTAERRQLESLAFGIAARLLDNARRTQWRQARLLEAIKAETVTRQTFVDDPADAPSADSAFGPLPEALRSLPPVEQEVLSYFIAGYKISEIAALLNCRPNTVSMRLYRARKTSKRLLQKVHEDE